MRDNKKKIDCRLMTHTGISQNNHPIFTKKFTSIEKKNTNSSRQSSKEKKINFMKKKKLTNTGGLVRHYENSMRRIQVAELIPQSIAYLDLPSELVCDIER